MQTDNIRNFCIIAHIDHGKSTLADRMLEYTGTITDRKMQEQVLDKMDLERERGITIKAQAVTIEHQGYELNLIDTPGHVDFAYEVSRSLAACEGAILVIDAAQGVEAQTMANIYLALEHDLEIIPVINKIDLPSANPQRVKEQLLDIGIDPDEAILASAKNGTNIDQILDAIIERVPAPYNGENQPLKALIFDTLYDSYQGVIAYVRVMNGSVKKGDKILLMSNQKSYEVDEVGFFGPAMQKKDELTSGEVGYIISGIKDVRNCRVGDTITLKKNPAEKALPGYKKVQPMVFSGLYPTDNADYEVLKEALEKLQLNDASFTFEPETSEALGFGFRCGFLGLLHMEVIQERLEREYDLDLVITAPSVEYQIIKKNGEELKIENPAAFPEQSEIDKIKEPFVIAEVHLPEEYVGQAMELCQDNRGEFKDMQYVDQDRVNLKYEMPLSEIITDFFNQLKSKTRGYATLDYELKGYKVSKLVKLDILVNKEVVDALSTIVHDEHSYQEGNALVRRLKEVIPRHMFKVPIQAAVGGKIIARVNIPAVRKDVLQKCYGGDVSRKRKLLEKQKEGKKRMKQVGSVEIPQEAFMTVLERDENA
ncbi:Translation elongation factor LepA [Halanaerobium saccharolyticum subsp. saccharolyticum DSM 6643]|uniref:Elongation factor 4 n=1 Tax=Halanaerobium saccharolyticum subsp. saccharolyticum DSM 6643 TaxID=1293054 RepID=M5E1W9_9FIRM|nr:translation elongation factor 4 [Halanaerobium saccharolyticum]CCU80469.1 Translation elongation factor LepA [Halanaerobium saccharolyticum subsp. saccharolyticum DSM 6643]